MPETSLRNDEQIRRNIELAYIGLTFKGELVDAASLVAADAYPSYLCQLKAAFQ